MGAPASEPLAGGRAILVLGPHRGGTSATTRILNLLGVDLGREEELDGAGGGNAKGLFENRRIMRINEAILRLCGGSWFDPPALPPEWERDPRLDDLRAEAREVLEANFAGRPLWGFKNPRTALTLPFWLQLIDDPAYVICLRNPLESASSLERRDGLPMLQGVALWARHMAAAIVGTAGARRILIDYDEYFTGRERAIDDLAAFVEADDCARGEHLLDHVDEWLASELRHHRANLERVLSDPSVPSDIRPLCAVLDLAVRIREPERGAVSSGPRATVDESLDAAACAFEQARLAAARRRNRPRHRATAGATDAVLAQRLADHLPGGAGALDFIVLGAPFAGTAALFDLLCGHPQLALLAAWDDHPVTSALPLSAAAFETAIRDDLVRGLVCPQAVGGTPSLTTAQLAGRLAAISPAVKLVVLLRDPVARALDHHRIARLRGIEHRDAERSLSEQLAPEALRAGRTSWSDSDSYVVWGEYGRAVGEFRRRLPDSELLVLHAEDLVSDPSPALGRLLRFVGVDDRWRPEQTAPRAGVSGEYPLATPEDIAILTGECDRVVFPLAGERAAQAQRAFQSVLERWTLGADRRHPPLSDHLIAALRAHFAVDAGRLAIAVQPTPGTDRQPDEHPGTLACVVDADQRFHLEALRWYASLTTVAGVAAQDLVIHAVRGASSDALDWLVDQGVRVFEIDPFAEGFPHCHKISGALSLAARGVDGAAILTDTDVAVCEDPRALAVSPTAVALKLVDRDNPPLALMEAVFDTAGVRLPPVVALDLHAEQSTVATNANGGLYAIHGDLLTQLAAAWAHWARWLHKRCEDEPDAVMRHTDQVAMALALAAEGIEVVHLDLRWNLPTHLPGALPADAGVPAIIHYHDRVDARGLIAPCGLSAVDERIRIVNEAISDVFARALGGRPEIEGSLASR